MTSLTGVKMKKLILLLLISSGLYSQTGSLSLKESLEIGLQNSREVKIAESELKYSLASIDEIASQMLPQLSFNASYTRLSDVPPFEVSVPIFPSPIKIQDAILNNYNFRLSVQQPLFTGFKLSSLKTSAKLNAEATDLEYSKSYNDKALAICEAFWKLYKTQIQVELLEENLVSLRNHLRDTEKFMANGLATKNDVLKIKVRVSSLEVSLIDAQNMMKLAMSSFNKELGIELNKITKLEVSDFSPYMESAALDELQNEAIKNRAELKSITLRKHAGENNVTAENSGWYPQVFAFGNFYYSNPNQRILPIEDEFNDTWDVGVSLKWNLWDWGNTSAKSEKAVQRVKQLENNFLLLTDAVKLEVYKFFLSAKSSTEKVKVNELAVQSAKENYRITEQKYNQQLTTSSELIDAEVDVLSSETNLLQAKVENELAKLRLENSLGRKIY